MNINIIIVIVIEILMIATALIDIRMVLVMILLIIISIIKTWEYNKAAADNNNYKNQPSSTTEMQLTTWENRFKLK